MTTPIAFESWQVRKPAVSGRDGLVASQHYLASEIGARVLRDGGNAVDAAVTAGLAIGTVEPWMSGLGGCGMMMIYLAKEKAVKAVLFGCLAPKALDVADYPMTGGQGLDLFGWPEVLEDRNVKGPHSMALPTYVAGMSEALERFGGLSWADALAPAIELADQGMLADWFATMIIGNEARNLAAYEGSRSVFLPGGHPPSGEWGRPAPRLKLGNLSTTLKRLADAGARDFYEGEIAAKVVADANALGSRLSLDDLGGYRAEIVDVAGDRQGAATIYQTPGMSAGPTLRQAQGLFHAKLGERGPAPDAAAYRAYADALSEAYDYRLAHLGHTDETKSPTSTTHLSVVDKHGNMVALTQTLLSIFGSRVLLPETGITMNNGIMWFDPRPGQPNSLGAGKHGLSNMCPTLVQRDDGLSFAIGASGGRRIMPAVFQLISYLVDYGMDIDEAVHHGRIDLSGGATVTADPRLGEEVMAALAQGYEVQPAHYGTFPVMYACPNLAAIDASGQMTGAAFIHSPWAKVAAA